MNYETIPDYIARPLLDHVSSLKTNYTYDVIEHMEGLITRAYVAHNVITMNPNSALYRTATRIGLVPKSYSSGTYAEREHSPFIVRPVREQLPMIERPYYKIKQKLHDIGEALKDYRVTVTYTKFLDTPVDNMLSYSVLVKNMEMYFDQVSKTNSAMKERGDLETQLAELHYRIYWYMLTNMQLHCYLDQGQLRSKRIDDSITLSNTLENIDDYIIRYKGINFVSDTKRDLGMNHIREFYAINGIDMQPSKATSLVIAIYYGNPSLHMEDRVDLAEYLKPNLSMATLPITNDLFDIGTYLKNIKKHPKFQSVYEWIGKAIFNNSEYPFKLVPMAKSFFPNVIEAIEQEYEVFPVKQGSDVECYWLLFEGVYYLLTNVKDVINDSVIDNAVVAIEYNKSVNRLNTMVIRIKPGVIYMNPSYPMDEVKSIINDLQEMKASSI